MVHFLTMVATALEDYYAILGIHSTASFDEIRAAYVKKFRELNAADANPELSVETALDKLREAFRTLGHAQKKQAYDKTLDNSVVVAADVPSPSLPPVATEVPAVAQAVDASPVAYRFSFTGNGGEYFRIWSVNLLLSLLTLGIYSAWAKVRREQYFHRNLMLDGSGFEYHATPRSILLGRSVVVVALVLLAIAKRFGSEIDQLAHLCLIPLWPWLTIRAFRFRAHNTSYRGLRFSYSGGYFRALIDLVGFGILSILSYGLLFPLMYRRMRLLLLENAAFGNARFSCTTGKWAVYKMFLKPIVLLVLLIIWLVFCFLTLKPYLANPKHMAYVLLIGFSAIFLSLLAFFAVIKPYVSICASNLFWSSTKLGSIEFSSQVPVGPYLRLCVKNWFLILLTLGLYFPWAKVSQVRMRAEHMSLTAPGGLDGFVSGELNQVSAVGDEGAEMLNLDIAL